jgi:hypothetical protein
MAETQSLFGPTPADLRAARQAQQAAFLERASQVNPSYAAGAGVGSVVGSIVGSLFGVENPELAKAKQMEEIQKEIIAENPTISDQGLYYDLAASKFYDRGYLKEFAEAKAKADAFRKEQLQLDLENRVKESQIEKNTAEKASALPSAGAVYAQNIAIISNPNSTPEQVAIAKQTISGLYPVAAASPLAGYQPTFGAGGVTSMTPVAGTPAAVEQEKASSKNKRQIVSNLNKSNLVSTNIDEALKLVSPKTTGSIGEATRMLPLSGGSDAASLASYVDTIKANIGFEQLNAMRQESPTGGALGNVAVKELDYLQASLGNLNPNLSEEVLKKNLEAVKTHYTNFMKELQKEMDTKFPVGKETSASPQQAATSKIVTIDNVDYQQTSNGKWVKVIK